MVFVLQSASFTFSVPKRPHVCLVSSQSFPHLWKKLWKITKFDDSSLFWADFSPIRRGRNLEKPSNWGPASLDLPKARNGHIGPGEAPPKAFLSEEMNLWEEILARIETKVNRHSFYTWFKPTTFVAEGTGAIIVRVPNPLFTDWLTKHYSGVIREAMTELSQGALSVNFIAESPGDGPTTQLSAADATAALEASELPLSAGAAGSAGLNPRYTFDTFIVGSSNQFAHAACRAVAEAPSRSYNPLFIYGGVGLGKTHLMHGIGHYVLGHDRNLKLTYISAERFMNEMINAVRYDRIIDFRERYRTVDVLLVDDVQFIAGKEGTQSEVFHTFNALYDSQKQIVISSDCPPHEIPQLEERLRSRFEWGLIADNQSPDLETKIAILKKKAETEE